MPDDNRQTVRTCIRCEQTTDTPVVVREYYGNSGPGWNDYACPACASGLLAPDAAWKLAIDHAWSCTACRAGSVLCPVGRTLDGVCRAARRRAQA